MLREKEAEIDRLRLDNLDQKRCINELVEQTQRSNQLSNNERESEVAQLRKELHDQDMEMLEAEQTIAVLIRDVQVAREVATRAEKAQREAEADQMLRHVLRDSDDEDTDLIDIGKLRSELVRANKAELQSSCRVSELEQELTAFRETAEMLSVELQMSKDEKHKMKQKTQHFEKALHELEVVKTKADEDIEHWKAVAILRQELVTMLQIQAKSLRLETGNLQSAIALCQQSASNRFQALKRDRQSIEADNVRLRDELSSVQQLLKRMDNKICKVEEIDFGEAAEFEEKLIRRVAEAQAHQKQLDRRITEVEQKVMATSSTNMVSRYQRKKTPKQLEAQDNECYLQLKKEHCHFTKMKFSPFMLKKATELALEELENVEVNLCEIFSNCSCCDGQHETLVLLAKQIIAEFNRYYQYNSLSVLLLPNRDMA
ncbi:hypothetical protein PsorP6_011745 [Peronosclerospora sorghi]|uniref:Uncharacterized protein n=1 Tax=Peronosclerospora sorghi TaxID=230839 RepID=A0ACC0WJW6_9STRA|nr:hypothetical protein PsorP6_011745 [Peronosclerospora sorghi]